MQLFKRALNYHQKGELSTAESLYRQILDAQPEHIDSLVNLSTIVYNRDPQSSLEMLKKGKELSPDSPSIHFNIGNLLQRHHYKEKAIHAFKKVISLSPNNSEAYFRLGILFAEIGKLNDAIAYYKKAFELKSDDFRVLNNLTDVYNRLNLYTEAEKAAQKALELSPHLAEAHGNLGNMYKGQGNYEKAEFHFKEALKSQPKNAKLFYHLGATLLFSNRAREAIKYFKKSIQIKPDFHQAHSSYLYALNYSENTSREEIFNAHCNWALAHSKDIKDDQWGWIKRNPNRKIRVGFVSPDFRAHVVALFIQQLFEHYDREQFEFYCYAEVEKPDHITSKFTRLVDGWRTTVGIKDEIVYETIKNDKIDVLIDLAGHSAGNRLTIFSMKPAPIQVSYLGYINTTGLNTIDYRFTDKWVNPENTQQFYSEKLFYIPNSFTCYEPFNPSPDVTDTPALKNGHITFGCFNNTNKLTVGVIKLWARLLNSIPDSKLLLKSSHLADKETCKRFIKWFNKYGILEDRIQLEGPDQIFDYLAAYSKIDIALDPFPHNGGTTSHDALWMGVPLIALEGDRYVSRFGVSILNNLGYPEWIAKSELEYLKIVASLTSDIQELNHIRLNLRNKLTSSPLCDGAFFSQHFETALKFIWRDFCDKNA